MWRRAGVCTPGPAGSQAGASPSVQAVESGIAEALSAVAALGGGLHC